jgi:AraC-like DNA-binding protein
MFHRDTKQCRPFPRSPAALDYAFPWLTTQAETIESALTEREWGIGGEARHRLSHAALIRSGRGYVVGDAEPVGFTAPALIWLPPRSASLLHLKAGSSGHLLGIPDDLLISAIGNSAESAVLGHIISRRLILPGGGHQALLDDMQHSFAAIEREAAEASRGSRTSVAAHIVLLLVGLWRVSGIEAVAGQSHGPASAILQRFRHLVELHYRDHWPISRFAEATGVSSDRLHALCRRDLGQSPLKLLHDRILREAQDLLDRSVLTIEQVSTHLGFSDPAHFSRFFKQRAGVSPATFRKNTTRGDEERRNALRHSSYADWP